MILRPTGMPVGRIFASRGAAVGCRRQHKKAAWPPKKRPRSGKKCCVSNRKGGIAAGRMPPRAAKGFNFVSAKPPLRRADSRFAEPRSFLQRGRFSCFSLVRKEPKVHQRFANLWTPGTIQSSAERDCAKISGGT